MGSTRSATRLATRLATPVKYQRRGARSIGACLWVLDGGCMTADDKLSVQT